MNPELLEKIIRLTAAYESVDDLVFVVTTEKGYWAGMGNKEGPLLVQVNCNDLFYWACADAEDIEEDDLPLLEECLKIDHIYGSMLFACRKRKMRPQNPWFKKIPEELIPHFEACGPPRTNKECG